MSHYLIPVCYTIFAWWFSTGIVLYLNKQSNRKRRTSFVLGLLVAVVSFYGLIQSSQYFTEFYVYVAFTQALLVWGWCEMSYFMGFITGPRKVECPESCSRSQRFFYAIETSLHHELLVIFIGTALIIGTWGHLNQIGMWTFVILWFMRWSAKLNLFLGVLNLNHDWIPENIKYIASYTKVRSMNFLFPFSVTIASVVATALVFSALSGQASSVEQTGLMLLATLLFLAVLEHWFLILPINDSILWNWATKLSQISESFKESTVTNETLPKGKNQSITTIFHTKQ